VCVGNSVVACEKNGHLGRRLRTCKEGCRDGVCKGQCSEAAKLIYLVDSSNNFLSFDPRKLPGDPFKVLGKLDCPNYGSPFSMSVDREGFAWVVYQDGGLYKVSITDVKCKSTGFVRGSAGSSTFGMGFATDEAGGKTEKLYVASEYNNQLWWIDTEHGVPTAASIGSLPSAQRNPELTGTSEGKLFGFYPDSSDPFVQEIDRKTAAGVGQKYPLGVPLGQVNAWAFAQWGGTFYIFVTGSDNTVRAIDRKTGEYRMVMESTPYRVTGAGVSTCAPERDAPDQQTAGP
jgi:hypothetical protein